MIYCNRRNYEFCALPENPVRECPAIILYPEAQAHLAYATGQWSKTSQQVLWMALKQQQKRQKTKNKTKKPPKTKQTTEN